MDLVDEQDHVLLALDLFNKPQQALLELTAILGISHQVGSGQLDQACLLQLVRNVTGCDERRQPLDNGGLANPCGADQDGVVLFLADQRSDYSAQFLPAAYERVEPVARCKGRQVAAYPVEDGCRRE